MRVSQSGKRAPVSPGKADEVSFINGLAADGILNPKGFWGLNGLSANKWGPPTAGTGATITYGFSADAEFTGTEKATFKRALAMWSAVADVRFKGAGAGNADVILLRASDGGAQEDGPLKAGSGATLGHHTGQAIISIDTSVPGFDLSGRLEKAGGYGFSTIVHEVGHLLGLGHSGLYNGDLDPKTDQFSAYDDVMWTTMSYIDWSTAGDAKYRGSYPVKGTNWGASPGGVDRQGPHTVMQLDIAAVQQLYGAAKTTPFGGGQTYGFRCNVEGPLAALYDFEKNKAPIVTLYNQGTGNSLDLRHFEADALVDLRPGTFSSAGGLVNNIAIAEGTVIERAVGGRGDDRLSGSGGDNVLRGWSGSDVLNGRAGNDVLLGGSGDDTFVFATALNAFANVDRILDFETGHDRFRLSDKYFRGLAEGFLDDCRLKEIASAASTAGVDRSDRILYDKAEGDLYFDRDGSGTRYERVKFAELRDHTAIDAGDFLIV